MTFLTVALHESMWPSNKTLRHLVCGVAILLCLMIAGTASATTYYVAASGSDSTNGTSTSTPWQHAPGMPNFTGAYSCSAGDRFIFRGGDAWHRSASTSDSSNVPMGGQWSWSCGGSSSNCNYPTVTSSCTYLG